MQLRSVPATCADTTRLQRNFGYKSSASLEDGFATFERWYREYLPVNLLIRAGERVSRFP